MKHTLVIALALHTLGCSRASSEVPLSDCEALRDHFVEVSLTTAAGVNPPSERLTAELAKHRLNLKANYNTDWIRRCQLESDPDWVSCSLGAHDKGALAICDAQKGTQ